MDLFVIIPGFALYFSFAGLFVYILYKTVFQRKNEIKAKFFAMRPITILIIILQAFLLYVVYYNLVYADGAIYKVIGLAIGLPFLPITFGYIFAAILPDYIRFGNSNIEVKNVKKVYVDERKRSTKVVILLNSGKKTTLVFSKKHLPAVKQFFGKKVSR